ncbi:hypothetical protein NX801_04995 [Streptomyces sp. LP05-1]|uniref:Uncharacterized protein n=1 Tax=Streptomyces pyxinae TaxID=2970734 RepID=A0ABT2CCA7_9ACTN|nr:hypothetical protein [Streptomyces sp. LP05-1]MCS0635024.1 hypothetical protein [Streptomyces sp. LP05-1]
MTTRPIPESVVEGALRRAHARHEAEQEANENPKAVAGRIKAAAKAAGVSPKEYIDRLVRDRAKLTPSDGERPVSAYWSHGLEHPEAPLNSQGQHFLSQRFIAEEWAHQQNQAVPGSAQTLETTAGGRELDDMFLWDGDVRQELGGEVQGFGNAYASECWGAISATYAGLAEGPTPVFAETAYSRSILYTQELDALQANTGVGLDNIHFVYEPPPTWPEVSRDELGAHAVRATVQFDDPTKPRYFDPQDYATQPPETRAQALGEVMTGTVPRKAEQATETGPDGPEPTPKSPAAETESETEAAKSATAEAGTTTAEVSGPEAAAPEAPTAAPPAKESTPTVEEPTATATGQPAPAAESPAPAAPAAREAPARGIPLPDWQLGFTVKPTAAAHGTAGQAAAAPESGPAPELTPRAAAAGVEGP